MEHPLLNAWRADTPGVDRVAHLNNAGAALPPKPVMDAMIRHLELERDQGGYEAAQTARKAIADWYAKAARLLGAEARNLAFASSATDAYNRALSSIPFQTGDVVITTREDYVSNQIAFLQLQQRFGIRLVHAADAPEGGVDPASIDALIRQYRPRLVAVTHIPTSSGLIQPVEAIGRICLEYDVLYLVDACQSAGQLPLDVAAIGCDFLSATFRKFLRGPRGAGFLYVSDRVLADDRFQPLFLDLHSATWYKDQSYRPASDAHRYEQWEKPYALMLGSKAAIEYALAIGLPDIASRLQHLAQYARKELAAIAGARVLDRGAQKSGIVTVHLPDRQPQRLKSQLNRLGINTSLIFLDSARYDFREKGIEWALRVSPHYYNTTQEVDQLVGALR